MNPEKREYGYCNACKIAWEILEPEDKECPRCERVSTIKIGERFCEVKEMWFPLSFNPSKRKICWLTR